MYEPPNPLGSQTECVTNSRKDVPHRVGATIIRNAGGVHVSQAHAPVMTFIRGAMVVDSQLQYVDGVPPGTVLSAVLFSSYVPAAIGQAALEFIAGQITSHIFGTAAQSQIPYVKSGADPLSDAEALGGNDSLGVSPQ